LWRWPASNWQRRCGAVSAREAVSSLTACTPSTLCLNAIVDLLDDQALPPPMPRAAVATRSGRCTACR
jgi:hypothetical protein